jgi:S-DNA-T family DNA segregation ATPase FtsK/SpoIIIE
VIGRAVTEGAGLFLLGTVVFGTLALATYAPADPIFSLAPVQNRFGAVGATFAALVHRGVGAGGFVLIGVLAVLGGRLIAGRGWPSVVSGFWVGSFLLLIAISTLRPLLHGFDPTRFPPVEGNALGSALAGAERMLVSDWGALLVNGVLLLVGVMTLTAISSRAAVAALVGGLGALGSGVFRLVGSLLRALRRTATLAALGVARVAQAWTVWRERRDRRARVAAVRDPGALEFSVPDGADRDATAPEPRLMRRRRGDPAIVDHDVERRREAPRQEAFRFAETSGDGPYELPDLSIFRRPPEGSRGYDRESLIMNSRILEKKLLDFGVSGSVVTVHPGPVVTMYEYEPASGIKVNRIVSLADDLALALRALSVRIIAPLPGKSVVGIEVPNPEREVVYIRELLDSETFRGAESKLTIALGKDIFGSAVSTDLTKMPHLLVAGATGTGKSVFLNAALCSLLFRATPDELKLLMVDPKILELSVYEGIPHLIADVVTNPKRAAAALFGIVQKMEERYQMMAAVGVRNIAQYNAYVDDALDGGDTVARFKAKPGEEEGAEFELRRLPYIVVVIDELADLMVVCARDVEEALQRLAQMARASGIHLILATQRPSVDVLTGVIKANFPARISFQVSSRTDSRTVLDQNGADHLLGQGDMLFLPPGTSKLQRVHGAYVSEKEVGDLVQALRAQGKPDFDETISRMKQESEEREARGEDVDEMYDRAIAIVAETRNASISYLQRRLKVGYNRAARMIEQMEADEVIGPQEGTKPREVYVRPFDVE